MKYEMESLSQSQEKLYGNCVILGKRPLAPMPAPGNCKRKIQFVPTTPQQPASVARRNARERNRVKQVNNGFAALRQHIPSNVLTAFPPQASPSQGRSSSKKLSKVETLRLAVEYIRSLQEMLDDNEDEMKHNQGDAGSPNENYFVGSPESTGQYSGYPIILPTPPSSEASVSPTPSQTSESSNPSYTSVGAYKPYGSYDAYDPNSPEDEELLDAIFSWQQTS